MKVNICQFSVRAALAIIFVIAVLLALLTEPLREQHFILKKLRAGRGDDEVIATCGSSKSWWPRFLRRVDYLQIRNCNGEDLQAIAKLQHLNTLSLESGSCDAESLRVLWQMKHLKHLMLHNIALDDGVLATLCEFEQLDSVELCVDDMALRATITDDSLPSLKKLGQRDLQWSVLGDYGPEVQRYLAKRLPEQFGPDYALDELKKQYFYDRAMQEYAEVRSANETPPSPVCKQPTNDDDTNPFAPLPESTQEVAPNTAAVARNGDLHRRQDVPTDFASKESTKASRFIDHGQYVEDTRTGLLWQKDGDESGKTNFFEAAAYAKQLRLGGLSGWRVPSTKELATIFPAADFPFVDSGYLKVKVSAPAPRSYWTCELSSQDENFAHRYRWYENGESVLTQTTNLINVRCVHDRLEKVE